VDPTSRAGGTGEPASGGAAGGAGGAGGGGAVPASGFEAPSFGGAQRFAFWQLADGSQAAPPSHEPTASGVSVLVAPRRLNNVFWRTQSAVGRHESGVFTSWMPLQPASSAQGRTQQNGPECDVCGNDPSGQLAGGGLTTSARTSALPSGSADANRTAVSRAARTRDPLRRAPARRKRRLVSVALPADLEIFFS
jgi:hypothetical protein